MTSCSDHRQIAFFDRASLMASPTLSPQNAAEDATRKEPMPCIVAIGRATTALPLSAYHVVSQIGGRRKSLDTPDCPARSRSAAGPSTNGDPNPEPSCFRPFLK